MAVLKRRLRASSAAHHAAGQATSVESALLDFAAGLSEDAGEQTGLASISDSLRRVHHILLDNPDQLKVLDDFREIQGFERLLTLIELNLHRLQTFDDDSQGFLAASLDVLAEALASHHGNRQYFSHKLQPSGWSRLRSSLVVLLDDSEKEHDTFGKNRMRLKILGFLFALAIRESLIASSFPSKVSSLISSFDSTKGPEELRTAAEACASQLFNGQEILCISDALELLFTLWSRSVLPLRQPGQPALALIIPLLVLRLVRSSKANAMALSQVTIGAVAFEAHQQIREPAALSHVLRELCMELVKVDKSPNSLALNLIRASRDSLKSRKLLFEAVKSSRQPSFLYFDMSACGYASVEFAGMRNFFPPYDANACYAITAWLRFDEFDSTAHTAIFGAFDESQTCFVLLYLERDTSQLVLQTSTHSSAPSVRFKSTVFHPNRWYHIAIVHKKGKSEAPSKAALFVDGLLRDQIKCHYPAAPPVVQSSAPVRMTTQKQYANVQAFFGTPKDLSPRHGTGLLRSKWALASAHLFSGPLPDEFIMVMKSLGPSYSGNFQDCLGSFQTYKASAHLNLHNEVLHPKDPEESFLARFLRSQASKLSPEDRIGLSLSAASSISAGIPPSDNLVISLSTSSFKALQSASSYGAYGVSINGAKAHIPDSITRPYGSGLLTGGTIKFDPQRIDDLVWQSKGAIPLCSDLVESSKTGHDLAQAIKFFFELLKDSWRNSEAAEREEGYGVLAGLLHRKQVSSPELFNQTIVQESPSELATSDTKTRIVSLDILTTILEYVGWDISGGERSLLINPLAYRILLVDCDVWRRCEVQTQDLLYTQYLSFSAHSKYSAFNRKRLGRMRILKRFVETWKAQQINAQILPLMMHSFKEALTSSTSPDAFRSVALFITSASGSSKNAHRPKGKHSEDSLQDTEIAVAVMTAFESVLLDATTDRHIRRFSRTVTNKWLLFLLAGGDERLISSAMNILSRLLTIAGESYVSKFETKTSGFAILQSQLGKWTHIPAVWSASFRILFGIDAVGSNFTSTDVNSLIDFATQSQKMYCPAMMAVILSMCEHAAAGKSDNASSNEVRLANANAALRIVKSLYEQSVPFHEWAVAYDITRSFLKPLYAASGYGGLLIAPDAERKMALGANTLQQHAESSAPSPEASLVLLRSTLSDDAKRNSAFIVVDKDNVEHFHVPNLNRPLSTSEPCEQVQPLNPPMWEALIDLITTFSTDMILHRKDFNGLALYLKAPAAPVHVRTSVNSELIKTTLERLTQEVGRNVHILADAKILSNISRFVSQLTEALYEGWFQHGLAAFIHFIRVLLNSAQTPEMRQNKSVRLASPIFASIRQYLRRISLFALIQCQEVTNEDQLYHVSVLNEARESFTACLTDEGSEELRVPEFLYISTLLVANCTHETMSHLAGDILRNLVASHPGEIQSVLQSGEDRQMQLREDFIHVVQEDLEAAIRWIKTNSAALSRLMAPIAKLAVDDYIVEENKVAKRSSKTRRQRRIERLEEWHLEQLADLHSVTEFENAEKLWTENICAAELWKYQRTRQDVQENLDYTYAKFMQHKDHLARLESLHSNRNASKWRLDSIEGRDRMRLRTAPAEDIDETAYVPKRERARSLMGSSARRNGSSPVSRGSPARSSTPVPRTALTIQTKQDGKPLQSPIEPATPFPDDGFEVVNNPQGLEEEIEDKNRKVMRSLQRGEHVQSVYNVTIIRGLEPCESLLIIGIKGLYVIENLFQRSDGEVVNAWDAPKDERDPYTQVISGRKVDQQKLYLQRSSPKTSTWGFSQIISISQRHFLFRDVALEIFFTDGQSFLLTTTKRDQREELCNELLIQMRKVKDDSRSKSSETSWRSELLQNPRDITISLGSRVASVFGSHVAYPFTKSWLRGEMSNFQYLMIVNTMAGRTFNDLTQYPVFPWVLSDYASEELDLTNPRSFRDLSKPMGCQTNERESALRERYKTFAEMTDGSTPPFHYGTHYSSAMIVTSYLIRLQPYVQAFLLLQGGNFDHPERMFSSIEKAWTSASQENFSDVRELTPEFFYLPEFLVNSNQYNFGTKSNGEVVNDVILPKWAKGDPSIFIAKHREALESEHVSKNLHSWIDLVFGQKQQGEAALENVNVFHHLSYHGAKELDTITDDLERMATIGIIHNFGQTPRQVFTKPHERRELTGSRSARVIKAMKTLSTTPSIVIKSTEQASKILYGTKTQKLLSPSPFEAYQPPNYDILARWCFTDRSVRFYSAFTSKPLGIFEQLHCGQITTAIFVDSRTFITASDDSTVSVWALTVAPDAVDMRLLGVLHGHQTAVTHLAAAPSLGTVISASIDGRMIIWDIHKLQMVRFIDVGAELNALTMNDRTGHILACTSNMAHLYTLNGRVLLEQALCDADDDYIASCAFHGENGSLSGPTGAWFGDEVVFSGHCRGVVHMWKLDVNKIGQWRLEHVLTIDHVDRTREDRKNLDAVVTSLLSLEKQLYVGDSEGRVFEWVSVR